MDASVKKGKQQDRGRLPGAEVGLRQGVRRFSVEDKWSRGKSGMGNKYARSTG